LNEKYTTHDNVKPHKRTEKSERNYTVC
jgi:hypothetical protein